MASLISYTKAQLIERVKRHIANDFPNAEFSTTDNEELLYIDQALAFTLVGQTWNNAKIEGNIAVPEAYLTTYTLPALAQDSVTKEWYATLPQPPVSLPLGYSVDECYAANPTNGKGVNVFWVKQKRVAFRKNLPYPEGVMAWIEGDQLRLKASSGMSLLGQQFYIRMASTRTSSLSDTMRLPDDAIESIFNNVVAKMKDRLQLPQDIIQDDLSSGNKTS